MRNATKENQLFFIPLFRGIITAHLLDRDYLHMLFQYKKDDVATKQVTPENTITDYYLTGFVTAKNTFEREAIAALLSVCQWNTQRKITPKPNSVGIKNKAS